MLDFDLSPELQSGSYSLYKWTIQSQKSHTDDLTGDSIISLV